jgi:AraC-like DNA-binding protein
MKARFEKIRPRQEGRSITSFRIDGEPFPFNWHFHPEMELTCIVRGSGSCHVGDCTRPFEPTEIMLLGRDLPHTWQSESNDSECSAIVIHFPEEIFSEQLLSMIESESLAQLLRESGRGLLFSGDNIDEIREQMTSLVDASGPSRIAILISILVRLSETPRTVLSSPGYQPRLNDRYKSRMDTVFTHLAKSYMRRVLLSELASEVHMSNAAFSRFFKRMTGVSFSKYVIDLRLNHACRLLVATDSPISSIAHESGFRNISNFNRRFIQKHDVSPSTYRRTRSTAYSPR